MLWEFISALCIRNVRGFMVAILVLQALVRLRVPSSTESPAGSGGSPRAPREGLHSLCGGWPLGMAGTKGAGLQPWKEKCWWWSLCGGCHCQRGFGAGSHTDSLPLLGTGLEGRLRRTEDKLPFPHHGWLKYRGFLQQLGSNKGQTPTSSRQHLDNLFISKGGQLLIRGQMEPGTTLSAPSICYRALQAYLSLPYGLKAGPNPGLRDRRSTDIPALQETPLVLGAGPGLLPPSPFPSQHSHG